METITPQAALERAIEVLGSQAELARRCGISQPAVWKWVKDGNPVPARFVLTVEAATGISRHLLNPDIYPIDDPIASPPHGGAATPESAATAGANQLSGVDPIESARS